MLAAGADGRLNGKSPGTPLSQLQPPFVRLLQIEAAEGHRSRNPPTALVVLLRTAQEPNRQMEVPDMAGIQEFSEKVITYATRLSDVADAAQGRRRSGGSRLRWTASGVALLALVRSDFFARQAKEVVNEAKTLASDLPDDLIGVVRQTGASGSRTRASQTNGSTRRSAASVAKTRTRKASASRKRTSTPRKRTTSTH